MFSIIHLAVINEEKTALKLISEMLKKISVLDILDHQNKKSKTPLHLAAESQQAESVKILLECQACPNRLDLEGETPVHIAARNNDLETLSHLVLFKVSRPDPGDYLHIYQFIKNWEVN